VMKAVIMAGGEGLRLRPFTYVVPKPLLPVGDISPIEYSVRYLKSIGFKEILISTNYLKEKFQICMEYVNKYDIDIRLIEEQVKLGTAGSLDLMRSRLDEPFALLNGDLLAQPRYDDMLSILRGCDADIVIGIKKYTTQVPYGVIQFNESNELCSIVEKPTMTHWISAGIYVLHPRVLNNVESQTYLDMPALIEKTKRDGKVLTFDIGDKWLDIGKVEDYENADRVLRSWEIVG